MDLHQPLTAADSGLQLGETGSSLSKIERLVTERLGSSTTVGAKPKTTLHKSDATPTFNFTPLESNVRQAKKKETMSSASKFPYKQANISHDWRNQTCNGRIQKPYR